MVIAAAYKNSGNQLVLSLVPPGTRRVLDIGCGAGDNARCLLAERPGIHIVGITHSAEEAQMAAPYLAAVHRLDIERDIKVDLGQDYDLLLFSHVLEHLRSPVDVIRRFLPLLSVGGHVLIAVPNTLEWRTRIGFLRGNFRYTEHGILDRTHLRFFTYETAPVELIEPLSELTLVERKGRGALPLGRLRRRLLSSRLSSKLDEAAVRSCPNVFAGEVAILARRSAS